MKIIYVNDSGIVIFVNGICMFVEKFIKWNILFKIKNIIVILICVKNFCLFVKFWLFFLIIII